MKMIVNLLNLKNVMSEAFRQFNFQGCINNIVRNYADIYHLNTLDMTYNFNNVSVFYIITIYINQITFRGFEV